LRLFQEGAGLAAYCHTVLEKARLQIEELSEQKEGESVGI
jgi:exonuclease VII small subunit